MLYQVLEDGECEASEETIAVGTDPAKEFIFLLDILNFTRVNWIVGVLVVEAGYRQLFRYQSERIGNLKGDEKKEVLSADI